MLEVSLLEYFVRGIPEGFLFVLAAHVFSKTSINLKKYLVSGTVFWLAVCLIKRLPVQYGINTILILIALIVIVSFINHIDIIKSIRSGIIVLILGFVSEGINAVFIQFVLKKDLKIILNNPTSKTLYGLPSLIFFGIFVIASYLILSKRKELKHV
jgi:hypothetical protein